MPDGLTHNRLYYAIRVNSTQIKIAPGLDEANSGNALVLNNKGGRIHIASNVSDKVSGDVGHPVQWDSTNTQWYINTSSTNGLYSAISTGNTDVITDVYIVRKKDFRRNRDLSLELDMSFLRKRQMLDLH